MNNVCIEPSRLLPEIDLIVPEIPQRSKLISLEPVGKTTGERESLWSYLHRLAEAHSVRFFDLLRLHFNEFSQELLGKNRTRSRVKRCGDWHDLIDAVNGPSAGYRVASVVQRLTCRSDLESLTLAPVCKTAGLSVCPRQGQAWCPDCLKNDVIPFERLSWGIAGVTHCSRHKTPLQDRCAHCGKPQLRFAAQSNVAQCMYCGEPKYGRLENEDALPDEFGGRCAGQAERLLDEAGRGFLVQTGTEIRNHNLRVTASLAGMGGITGFSSRLVIGRTTARSWLHDDCSMPLGAALKWAWIVGVDSFRLFSTKLAVEDLTFTPLPDSVKQRKRKARNRPVPPNSTALYLAALRLSAANPFIAPRRDELVTHAGIHPKHPAFKEPPFVRLMNRLRNHERCFVHKERVWREVVDVHSAALKVIAQNGRLTRRRVGSEMSRPGCFCGPLARAYLKWFKKRLRKENSSLGPKRIPVDVRAYWDLMRQSDDSQGS